MKIPITTAGADAADAASADAQKGLLSAKSGKCSVVLYENIASTQFHLDRPLPALTDEAPPHDR